jgi:single-strand DNA-binding protein
MCIARYTLAVDRKFAKNDDQKADFIPCIAFGKSGEFAEKYFRKGMSVAVSGRIQAGSYTNKDGQKVYTTDVVIEDQEFAESKTASNGGGHKASADDFTNMTNGLDDELPFT